MHRCSRHKATPQPGPPDSCSPLLLPSCPLTSTLRTHTENHDKIAKPERCTSFFADEVSGTPQSRVSCCLTSLCDSTRKRVAAISTTRVAWDGGEYQLHQTRLNDVHPVQETTPVPVQYAAVRERNSRTVAIPPLAAPTSELPAALLPEFPSAWRVCVFSLSKTRIPLVDASPALLMHLRLRPVSDRVANSLAASGVIDLPATRRPSVSVRGKDLKPFDLVFLDGHGKLLPGHKDKPYIVGFSLSQTAGL